MKNYHLFIAGLCLLLSSCAVQQVTYFGDKLTPTTSVEIYYSEHDVKKDFKVIGHLTCINGDQEKVKAYLTTYAKSIGADAIVITGNQVDTSGKYSSDYINAEAVMYNR